jgi:hypothetical protein
MSLLHLPVQAVQERDLLALVTNCVQEGRAIEYKAQLPGGSDADKREFLADVTSFANATGGDLLFGVEEERGLPVALPGLELSDLDAAMLRLDSIVRDGCRPRVGGISSARVPLANGRTVLAMRIPRSWTAPHMVTFGNLSRFYARNMAGKYQLDVTELRRAFMATGESIESAMRFRLERVSRLVAGETPLPLHAGPRLVLQMYPLVAADPEFTIDLPTVIAFSPMSIYTTQRSFRYNLEGVVSHGPQERDRVGTYLQVFRNGRLETVTSRMITREQPAVLRTEVVEKQLFDRMDHYQELYRQLDVPVPVAIMITLLDVEGFRLLPANPGRVWHQERPPLARADLVLPEVMMIQNPTESKELLRPTLDILWQSFGWEYCRNYDNGGQW